MASNDGYLLQHFKASGHSRNRNRAGEERRQRWPASRGIPHGDRVPRGNDRRERSPNVTGVADLVVANNVFAHVPDIRDFAAGLRTLVKDFGLVTLQFPHLLRLMQRRQFDTIYHQHYSYLSLFTAGEALAAGGLPSSTSKNSIPMVAHSRVLRPSGYDADAEAATLRVNEVLEEEELAGLHSLAGHAGFAREVLQIKSDLLDFFDGCGKGGTIRCWLRSSPVRATPS